MIARKLSSLVTQLSRRPRLAVPGIISMELSDTLPLFNNIYLFFGVCLATVPVVIGLGLCTHGRDALPPGPRRLPFVGNLFDLPKHKLWVGFRDIAMKHGGRVVYMEVLRQPMLIINDAFLAATSLEKANTSDRPHFNLVNLSGQGYNFAFSPYGSNWRAHRREFHRYFHQGVVPKYKDVQRAETHKFLARVLKSQSQLPWQIKTYLAAIILKILYGIDIVDEKDEHVLRTDGILEALVSSAPGRFLFEYLPVLRHVPAWFPGAGFQRMLVRCRAANAYLEHVLFDEIRETLKQGEPCGASVATTMLQGSSDATNTLDPEKERILKNVCATAFEGATDTSFSLIQAALVALATNPDAQRKAQAELDTVVGPGRLPDYDDSDTLVYVNALIRELLRWHIVAPLLLPHLTIEDDVLDGYLIPAGTAISVNVWAMLHDPDVYDDPDKFLPERFITPDGKLNFDIRDPTRFVFGFGRRMCPGRHFAQNSLFIAIASVLHVFDVSLPLDEAGKPIPIKYEPTDGLICYPKDSRCIIKPRSLAAEALIRNAG
ncbi:CyP450 monooxygenase [Trametes elegans]|nr:CyP450 monooxygenase [Trametes elegans]